MRAQKSKTLAWCVSPTLFGATRLADTELILEPLLKLSFFVAHALYHHAGTLSDPPAASSQLLSAIQSDVPKGLSSSLSRKMANLTLGGGTSQQENQFSIGQGKGLNQVSQVCVPSLIN